MEETLLPIEEFNELLKNWEGKYIKVSKYEKNDHDETFLLNFRSKKSLIKP